MQLDTLIPMSDFVLQFTDAKYTAKGAAKNLLLNFKYAYFLKQPLDIGMFLPCLQGDYFGIPERSSYITEADFFIDMGTYNEIKEMVLFEGFQWKFDAAFLDVKDPENCELIYIDDEYCQNRTIESLLTDFHHRFKLTTAAQKQLSVGF
jgi:hypothetical protein